MTRLAIRDVLDCTGAVPLRGSDRGTIEGVGTDTRTLRAGELFLALSGPSFDGNAFADAAARCEAGMLLLRGTADDPPAGIADLPADLCVAIHPDPRRALRDLAAWHRSTLDLPVIGITGSCGKTTTKNVLVQLLETTQRVVGSPSSFNNDIGVPLTLLLADATTDVLVVELGTNRPGEIASLARIARPTCGIVTNIGASHLEGLGSVEGVAREKADLFAALPRDGLAVLNADCAHADLLRSSTAARVITFGVEGEADLAASDPWFHAGGTTFRLDGVEVTSPLLGLHNVENLLAALAACRGLDLDLGRILPGVARLRGGKRRMERRDLGDVVVFDDTYNANPDSARAGVRVLCGVHGHARRVLVLGDMLELGERAPELHYAIGRDAARHGIDLVVGVGELCRAAAAGALEGGLPPERVLHLGGVDEAVRRVPDLLSRGDVVLFKASRRTGLERVVEALENRRTAPRVALGEPCGGGTA